MCRRDRLGEQGPPVQVWTPHRQRRDDVRRGGGRDLAGGGAAHTVGDELEVRPGEAGVLVVLADEAHVGGGSVGEVQHPSLLPGRSVRPGTPRDPDRLSTAPPDDEQSVVMEARSAALDRAREHAMAWLATLDERPVPPSADGRRDRAPARETFPTDPPPPPRSSTCWPRRASRGWSRCRPAASSAW